MLVYCDSGLYEMSVVRRQRLNSPTAMPRLTADRPIPHNATATFTHTRIHYTLHATHTRVHLNTTFSKILSKFLNDVCTRILLIQYRL